MGNRKKWFGTKKNGPDQEKMTWTDEKKYKLQNTNPKGSHGLHQDSFKLQTMTAL